MSMTITPLLCAATLCCASAVAHAADAPATDNTIRIALASGIGNRLSRNRPGPGDQERALQRGDRQGAPANAGRRQPDRPSQHTARAYRDSAGRTREESLNDKGDVRMVVIKDPVAGVRWILSPQAKTATRISMPAGKPAAFYKAPQDGNMHVLERTMSPDGSAEHDRHEARGAGGRRGAGKHRRSSRCVCRRDASRMNGALPQMNLLLSGAYGDMKWSRHATSKTLAPREIDGVKATGQVRSYEIPAGELGNRNPIVVSDETWYAPDLHITLSSKHSDPRTGDSLFRIENLKRDEPAPALFAPPADYAVKDLGAIAPARQPTKKRSNASAAGPAVSLSCAARWWNRTSRRSSAFRTAADRHR